MLILSSGICNLMNWLRDEYPFLKHVLSINEITKANNQENKFRIYLKFQLTDFYKIQFQFKL